MPRHSRPHPVYSFRFWLLVLAAVGFTAAWKLELLPLGKPRPAATPAAHEIELGDSDSGVPADDAEIFQGQSEPGAAPAAEHVTVTALQPRVMPRSDTVAQSPFGTPAPEFVSAAPARGAPPAAPEPQITPAAASSFNPSSTGIVLAADESAPEAPANPFADSAAPESPAEPPAFDFTEIDVHLNAGTKDGDVAAHRVLSELYWQHPELRPQLSERIEQTARRIYFQPQPHYFDEYVVEPGETLQAIARKYSVSWQYLDRLNRVKGKPIQVGQSLKVIKGPFAAVVDLSDYEITVHCHGHYVYRFPVGVGMDGSTPIGTFAVEDKMANPPYNGPEGSFAADDPANPVGERWISLGGGYGIHGTTEPESIGKSESLGCIRMHSQDVEIVFDLLTVGSEVVIQR
ncbi:MAG: L,D-transpeptidase family protein [Planctomycetaceae bacterium]|nr:L,D-transpeptidase family protein [Planctomycetaceae bacterium]